MKAGPRLFIDQPLCAGESLTLDRDASHYVLSVMRRRVGDELRLFNGRDGEWLATISQAVRKTAMLRIASQSRQMAQVPDLWLLFAPVKKARTAFIVEKATELGVRAMQMVTTRRTTAKPLRDERLGLICREAAEQTERLDLPQFEPHARLETVLKNWDATRHLFFCDEAGDGADADAPWGGRAGRALPMAETLARLKRAPEAGAGKAAILIGPEGGFAPQEREILRGLPFVHPVTLGPRILRADTAAVAALTLWQSANGDWNG